MLTMRAISTAVVGIVVWAVAAAFAMEGEADTSRRPGPRHEGPPAPEEVFGEMDADGDGQVTLEEFTAHHEQHGPPRSEGRARGPGGFGHDRGPHRARPGYEGDRGDPPHRGEAGYRPPGPPHQFRERGPMRIGACPHCEGTGAAIKSGRMRGIPMRGGPHGPQPHVGRDHPHRPHHYEPPCRGTDRNERPTKDDSDADSGSDASAEEKRA